MGDNITETASQGIGMTIEGGETSPKGVRLLFYSLGNGSRHSPEADNRGHTFLFSAVTSYNTSTYPEIKQRPRCLALSRLTATFAVKNKQSHLL